MKLDDTYHELDGPGTIRVTLDADDQSVRVSIGGEDSDDYVTADWADVRRTGEVDGEETTGKQDAWLESIAADVAEWMRVNIRPEETEAEPAVTVDREALRGLERWLDLELAKIPRDVWGAALDQESESQVMAKYHATHKMLWDLAKQSTKGNEL